MNNTKNAVLLAFLFVIPCGTSTLFADADEVVAETAGVLSAVVQIPIHIACSIYKIIGWSIDECLACGVGVVNSVGYGLIKVGDVGYCLMKASDEHPIMSGIAGIGATIWVLTHTEMGRMILQRSGKALSSLLGLDQAPTRCVCDDHRTIASYLEQ